MKYNFFSRRRAGARGRKFSWKKWKYWLTGVRIISIATWTVYEVPLILFIILNVIILVEEEVEQEVEVVEKVELFLDCGEY